MKFIQLLIAFALLLSASSVANAQPRRPPSPSKAQKDPPRPGPGPKPPRPDDNRSCNQAERQAKRAVQRIYDGDCNNALDRDFTRKVNRMRDRKFPRNARNRKDRQYNNCGRDAIKTELNRIGRQCRNSGQAAKDCNDLGKVAAGNIVDRSNVCPAEDESEGYGASHHNLQKFRRECRSVAYGKCKGFITNAVRQCGGDRLSLRKQSRLQDECEDEVDSMTGYDDDSEGLDYMTNNAQFFETSEDTSSGEGNYYTSEDTGSSDSADYYDTW